MRFSNRKMIFRYHEFTNMQKIPWGIWKTQRRFLKIARTGEFAILPSHYLRIIYFFFKENFSVNCIFIIGWIQKLSSRFVDSLSTRHSVLFIFLDITKKWIQHGILSIILCEELNYFYMLREYSDGTKRGKSIVDYRKQHFKHYVLVWYTHKIR